MKITITFLLLGVCLVSTNAFIVGKQKKKMSESEAYSLARMMTLSLKRWNDWQNCHMCNDVEKYCMEKALVEDLILIVKVMANDMGCKPRDILGGVKFEFHVSIVINAVEYDEVDRLVQVLREQKKTNHFVHSICGMMDSPLKQSNVVMGEVFGVVNEVLEGGIGGALNLVGDVVSGLAGALGGIVGGLTSAVGGVAKAATGVVGGLTGAVGGLVGGLTGGLLGGKQGLLG